jgi:hypothetical protein
MRKRPALAGALPGLASLSLLLAAERAAADDRAPVPLAPTRAVLLLISGSEASQSLAQQRPATIDPSSRQEAELLRECANDESQRPTRSFVFSFITQGWHVLLHPVAVSVHDELLKYAKVSDATANGDYYAGGEPSTRAPLNSRISCLRFMRLSGESDNADVALDFVAGVRLDSARDAIRLRPLRLYISQGGAKSADGHYSVAIAVRASAVWRDEFAGHQGPLFEETVATESVNLKTGSFLKYYPTDAASGTRVPIVPLSFGLDRTRDFGRAEFGVRVAEIGTPPATLKLLADMLPDPNEKVSQLLIAAALAGLP